MKNLHYHTETILNGRTYSISPRCNPEPLTKVEVRAIRKADFDRGAGWTYKSIRCMDQPGECRLLAYQTEES